MNASLSSDMLFFWGGKNNVVQGVVRSPQLHEVPSASWIERVEGAGADERKTRIPASPVGLLLYADPGT